MAWSSPIIGAIFALDSLLVSADSPPATWYRGLARVLRHYSIRRERVVAVVVVGYGERQGRRS